MDSEVKTKKRVTKLSVMVPVMTAAITALTTIIVAKFNGGDNADTKARAGYELLVHSVSEVTEHTKKNADDIASLNVKINAMNEILQFMFMSEAGLRNKSYIPQIPTYEQYKGMDRPPVRTITPRKMVIPPPKEAATKAVEKLQQLKRDDVGKLDIKDFIDLPTKDGW